MERDWILILLVVDGVLEGMVCGKLIEFLVFVLFEIIFFDLEWFKNVDVCFLINSLMGVLLIKVIDEIVFEMVVVDLIKVCYDMWLSLLIEWVWF